MSDVEKRMPKEYSDQFDKLLEFMYSQVPGVAGKPIGSLHEHFL